MGGNRDKGIDKDGAKSESEGESESGRMIAGERERERGCYVCISNAKYRAISCHIGVIG